MRTSFPAKATIEHHTFVPQVSLHYDFLTIYL